MWFRTLPHSRISDITTRKIGEAGDVGLWPVNLESNLVSFLADPAGPTVWLTVAVAHTCLVVQRALAARRKEVTTNLKPPWTSNSHYNNLVPTYPALPLLAPAFMNNCTKPVD
jgi:hypothetical protein